MTRIFFRQTFILILLLTGALRAACQIVNEDSLWQIIHHPRADTLQVDALNTLATYLLNHKKDEAAGLPVLQRAMLKADSLQYLPGKTQSLLISGNYHRKKSRWNDAIDAYGQILQLSSRRTDSVKYLRPGMMALNNLAAIYNINGDYTTALDYRLQSLSIAEKINADTPALVTIYTNIASEYRQLQLPAKAREYAEKARPLARLVKAPLRFSFLYESYQLQESVRDTSAMMLTLHEMEEIAALKDLSNYQRLDFNYEVNKLKGIYYRDFISNYSGAISAFESCIEIAGKMDDDQYRLSSTYNLAHTYYLAGRTSAAIPLLRQVYDDGMSLDIPFNSQKAAYDLFQIYEEQGDYRSALLFFEKQVALRDSMRNAEKLRQLNFLEAKYQNEKKATRISGLEKDNALKELEVTQKNNWLLITTGTIIVLGLVSLLVYRASRQRRMILEKEKKLQSEKILTLEKEQQVLSLQAMVNGQEMERTRIAKDLHDGLGGLLSTVKMHYSLLPDEAPSLSGNQLYNKTSGLINTTADELRRVAHNMMPEVLLKVGLTDALKDLSNNISAGKVVRVTFQSFGMQERLSAATEIMLYRIVQELMNNIIKHSAATEALIQLNRENNRLSLTVEDNGNGFDTRAATDKRSMGIDTVKSRVDYLKGQLSIDSQKDIGTTVMINLLLDEGKQ